MATTHRDDDTRRDVRAEVGEAVNMTSAQLRRWLDTDHARSGTRVVPVAMSPTRAVALLADDLGSRSLK